MRNSISVVAFVAIASGCAYADSGTYDFETVGTAKLAVAVSSGRSVPYPIVRRGTPSTGIYDVIDPLTNKPRVSWDRSHAELLIADEYAKCVGGSPVMIRNSPGRSPRSG
jgi:hypothetical protein